MNWLTILEAILKDASDLIPIFVHSKKTGKVSAVIYVPADEVAQIGPKN